jgi:hypothetical protein
MDYKSTQAALNKSPGANGFTSRLDRLVTRQLKVHNTLRQTMIRLRGSIPEELGPTSPVTPREIPSTEHLGSLEELESSIERLVEELDNLI